MEGGPLSFRRRKGWKGGEGKGGPKAESAGGQRGVGLRKGGSLG